MLNLTGTNKMLEPYNAFELPRFKYSKAMIMLQTTRGEAGKTVTNESHKEVPINNSNKSW
jgi:hypothetical protein